MISCFRRWVYGLGSVTGGGGVEHEIGRPSVALAVGGGARQGQRAAPQLARHEAVAARRRAVARHRRRHHEWRAVLVPAAVARVGWEQLYFGLG